MKQHLRVLLYGSAMLLGSATLAVAQPATNSDDRGYSHQHRSVGMEGPRAPMMSPRHGHESNFTRSNQQGYGADPYRGRYPEYGRSDPYSGYDSWDRERWDGHSGGGHGHHYHHQNRGHHHQGHHDHPHHGYGYHDQESYDGHGHGHGYARGHSQGHGDGWDQQRGYHDRRGSGHGPHFHRQGSWDHKEHMGGGMRERMGERRMKSAMQFHGVRIDTNDDGVISPDEAAAHAETIFVLLDRNMDGVLSEQDRRGRGAWRDAQDRRRDQRRTASTNQERQQSEDTDDDRDTGSNGSAQASSDQATRSARMSDEDRPPSHWQRVFAEMDANGDGEVTMEEFMTFHEERYNELAGDEGEVSPWRYRASWHSFTSND